MPAVRPSSGCGTPNAVCVAFTDGCLSCPALVTTDQSTRKEPVMSLFHRAKQDDNVIATGQEIDAAARAIANDDADSQRVAMAILARSVDYTPQED